MADPKKKPIPPEKWELWPPAESADYLSESPVTYQEDPAVDEPSGEPDGN